MDFPTLGALATTIVLPLFGYLIVRRDGKLDTLEKDIRTLQMDQVRQDGAFKALLDRVEAVVSELKELVTKLTEKKT